MNSPSGSFSRPAFGYPGTLINPRPSGLPLEMVRAANDMAVEPVTGIPGGTLVKLARGGTGATARGTAFPTGTARVAPEYSQTLLENALRGVGPAGTRVSLPMALSTVQRAGVRSNQPMIPTLAGLDRRNPMVSMHTLRAGMRPGTTRLHGVGGLGGWWSDFVSSWRNKVPAASSSATTPAPANSTPASAASPTPSYDPSQYDAVVRLSSTRIGSGASRTFSDPIREMVLLELHSGSCQRGIPGENVTSGYGVAAGDPKRAIVWNLCDATFGIKLDKAREGTPNYADLDARVQMFKRQLETCNITPDTPLPAQLQVGSPPDPANQPKSVMDAYDRYSLSLQEVQMSRDTARSLCAKAGVTATAAATTAAPVQVAYGSGGSAGYGSTYDSGLIYGSVDDGTDPYSPAGGGTIIQNPFVQQPAAVVPATMSAGSKFGVGIGVAAVALGGVLLLRRRKRRSRR